MAFTQGMAGGGCRCHSNSLSSPALTHHWSPSPLVSQAVRWQTPRSPAYHHSSIVCHFPKDLMDDSLITPPQVPPHSPGRRWIIKCMFLSLCSIFMKVWIFYISEDPTHNKEILDKNWFVSLVIVLKLLSFSTHSSASVRRSLRKGIKVLKL